MYSLKIKKKKKKRQCSCRVTVYRGMFGEVSWEDQRWQVAEEFESVASEIMK